MTHGDDNGLVLPPNLAPIQVVIIPIYKGNKELKTISKVAHKIYSQLIAAGISVKYDDRDNFKPGFKFNDYELKGVPIRIAIGPRDLENNVGELARRDTLEKKSIPMKEITNHIKIILEDIQNNLFDRANSFREERITAVETFDEFK